MYPLNYFDFSLIYAISKIVQGFFRRIIMKTAVVLLGMSVFYSVVAEAQVAKISNPALVQTPAVQYPVAPQSEKTTKVSSREPSGSTYAEDVNNNPAVKLTRGFLKNSGDQKSARNLMVVQAVSEYKLEDEQLKSEIEELKNNKEYNKKLEKIMKNLNNKKMRNTKNKQAMRILEDAGEKLYKLLAN